MKDRHVVKKLYDWRSAVASKFGPESPITRHVLLTLSLYMSPKGDSCFPSVRLLAEETALARTTVMKHLEIAFQVGWIVKIERPQRNGHGWRRMEYIANVPKDLEAKIKASLDEGGPPDGPASEGGPFDEEGGPSDSENVVHQADLKYPVNYPIGLPPEEKGQSQNQPQGPTCAHCKGSLKDGHARLSFGKVCNHCYRTYLDAEWVPERAA